VSAPRNMLLPTRVTTMPNLVIKPYQRIYVESPDKVDTAYKHQNAE